MAKSKKILWRILEALAGALLLGGAVVWALWPRPVPVEIAKVERGPFEMQVVEEGKTRAREIYQIMSTVTGNMKRVQLHPGDRVQEGDLLAEVFRPERWLIKAPISGRVLRVQRESDGPVVRGDLLMEIADPTSLEVVAEVLTEDALAIKPGAPVRMESWGACPPLEGKVRIVEPAAFTKVSALGIEEQRVKVIMDILSPVTVCEGLADGFRMNNLITTHKEDMALTIPTGALFRVGADWAVFRVDQGRAKKNKVKISRRNPERAVIEEGLEAGDEIIIYPSDNVEDATRVEPLQF